MTTTRTTCLRRALTAALLTAAVLAAPTQAGNPRGPATPRPPSPYTYGICNPATNSCLTFRLPRPAGWLVDRAARIRRVTPAAPGNSKLPPGVWR